MRSPSIKEKIITFFGFVSPILAFAFMTLQKKLRNFFRSKFDLLSSVNMGVNTLFVFFTLFTLWKLAHRFGNALADQSTGNWKGVLPLQRYLLYTGLQVGAFALYVSVAVGEIYALAIGLPLAFTLPFTLGMSYFLFVVYDVIQMFKIYETLQYKNTPEKQISLQNKIFSMLLDLALLLSGIIINILFPELIIVTGVLIILQIINPFIPKDGLRKIFFDEIKPENIFVEIKNSYTPIGFQLKVSQTNSPRKFLSRSELENQNDQIKNFSYPSKKPLREKYIQESIIDENDDLIPTLSIKSS